MSSNIIEEAIEKFYQALATWVGTSKAKSTKAPCTAGLFR